MTVFDPLLALILAALILLLWSLIVFHLPVDLLLGLATLLCWRWK